MMPRGKLTPCIILLAPCSCPICLPLLLQPLLLLQLMPRLLQTCCLPWRCPQVRVPETGRHT